MSAPQGREAALFQAAVQLTGAERAAFLNGACLGDDALRHSLEALLAASDEPGESTSKRASAAASTIKLDLSDKPDEALGQMLGRYKLLERVGEGGCGVVYVAEQTEPVRRRVALKVIKLGMDTKQVVARFEAERQALAMMDHPNIAKVLDAGTTELGRPYFVMELVRGIRVTDYCDQANLATRERLNLFVKVCQAIQHAHQKGIIHRDIKPSNILVTLHDGVPVPKVIDFGIAKATEGRLTEATVYTQLHQFIGTPAYMSPEQAEMSGLDIDTRTDIYSLGVLLYELLAGSTPFDAKQLVASGIDAMRRIIREQEPVRPSTRFATLKGEDLTTTAKRRSSPAQRLIQILKGDLDWIVMKCLEKDRQRRYETANGLAMDINRHLRGEPVEAAPPSSAYRLKKFFRRNQAAVAAGLAVALALLIGVVGFAWQAAIARHQLDRAVVAEAESKHRADELAKVADFQASMLSQIDATDAGAKLMASIKTKFNAALEKGGVLEAERNARAQVFQGELAKVNATDTAAEMIERTILKPAIKAVEAQFKDQPRVDAKLRLTLADLYRTLGLYPAALELLTNAVNTRRRLLGDDDPATLASRRSLAELLDATARTDEAIGILQDVLERGRRVQGPDHPDTLNSMADLGDMLRSQGKFAQAEPLLRGALDGNRRVRGPLDRMTLSSMNTYGQLLMLQGKPAEAEPYWREAYETGKRVLGPDDPDTLVWTHNLGGLMLDLGRLEEAADRYREAAEAFRRVYGEEHPSTLTCLNSLSMALSRLGKHEEAGKILTQVLGAQRRSLGEEHPSTLGTMTTLGANLRAQGHLAESEAILRQGLASRRRVQGNENLSTLDTMFSLAETLSQEEKFAESNLLFLEQIGTTERVVGKNHPVYLNASLRYGISLTAQNKFDESEPYLRWAVEARQKISGRTHATTGSALNGLGILLRGQGKLAEAEATLREAVDILRAALSKDNPGTIAAIADLANVLVALGKLEEAETLCREALAGFERVAGKDSIQTVPARSTMGRLRMAQKKFAEAEIEFLEANRAASAAREGSARSRREAALALQDLYEAWNTAEPGKGYDARSAEWKTKLAAIAPPTPERKP